MLQYLTRLKILQAITLNLLQRSKNTEVKQSIRKYNNVYGKKLHVPGFIYAGFISYIHVVHAARPHDKAKNTHSASKEIALINTCDEYFSVGKYKESLDTLVEFKDAKNVEILWRISRALYNLSKQKGIKPSESSGMILEAFECVKKALELDDKHYAVHKWMAILVDAKSSLDGLKSRISTLPVFKHHLLMAMELNPKDATSIYMLGQYCYNLAETPWLHRQIAAALFGSPPVHTFEEALGYFSKAEEVEPNFYSLNLLMLGKTYLKLKKVDAARYWLKCASTYPVRTDEDEMVRKEAEELLKKHPAVKVNSNGKVNEKPQMEESAGNKPS